ncbi:MULTISPECIES: hypothetical protein [unclassified Robiginitalea]|uniref:hypothetical protein n=1 Tax=Robiginitalea TaxID=252306 RepID=UPI00234A6F99|nr:MULTISPECIES: hypothetical protein [unclassified Robiginitalea]MDC6353040.1 hypothetical protein [Robiginitalea sp. PM2]MDC6373793.1 hypothetical protein [Robiginitalea sp. SP8]
MLQEIPPYKTPAGLLLRRLPALLFLLAGLQVALAQSLPLVSSEVDTTAIRIGEQIRFTVRVEADTTAQVIFPDGQTFSPLETVEAFKTDTTRRDNRLELLKTYALTQFDSGAYLLPSQRIEIDGKGYFTDSLFVSVATVPVDTLEQNLYDIKPMVEVEGNPWRWIRWLGWTLLVLLLAGGALYWFVFREKPLTEAEQEALLPPYDRALIELERLESTRYLIQDDFKGYYTELTTIVRAYLEEEVHVTALESTTEELITKLELLRDAGQLNLDAETLNRFRRILQTADLVKFAKSKPPLREAEADREQVRDIVVRTHDALPEPTEEELMEQEEYRQEILSQRRRKRLRVGLATAAGILVVGLVSALAYFGPGNVREAVFGTPTKSLLEGEWIASSYGYPPILLETPEVLYRKEVELPAGAKGSIRDMDVFGYDNRRANFSIMASSTLFADPESEPDFEQSIEKVLEQFEASGARNIIMKQESFTTISGVEGVRVYGKGTFDLPDSSGSMEGAYSILVFGGKGFLQQVVMTWEDGDAYSEDIVERIVKTLEVKTTV